MSNTKQQQPQEPTATAAAAEPSTAIARREARPSIVATVADLQALGTAIAQSGMFGQCTPGKGLVIWSICDQENMSLLRFMQTYHVTDRGQISMRADRMYINFRKLGGKLTWIEHSNDRAAARFTYDTHQDVEFEFTIEDAKRAELLKEKSQWLRNPGAMLRARLLTTVIRMICPEACDGFYTPEELDDWIDSTAPAPTQAAPARKVPPQPQPQPQQRTAAEQAAIATVADALDGEIVDDAPESPMDPPPPPPKQQQQKPKPKTKAAAKPKAAAPAPPPNFAVCPIPGKLHGKAWDTMDRSVLQHALDNMRHQLEPGHIAEIERLMAPKPEDTLPF